MRIPPDIVLGLQAVGGAVGNMICVHNVVVVCAVVGLAKREGIVIRRNIVPVVIYALAAGFVETFIYRFFF